MSDLLWECNELGGSSGFLEYPCGTIVQWHPKHLRFRVPKINDRRPIRAVLVRASEDDVKTIETGIDPRYTNNIIVLGGEFATSHEYD